MPDASQTTAPAASQSQPRARALWPRLLFLAAVAGAVIAYFATGLNQRLSANEIRSGVDHYRTLVAENLPVALIAFFGVYVFATALSLPIAVWLSLLAGALFGRWAGTAVVLSAATLGATLAFLSTRYVFRGYVQSALGDHLSALNRGMERDGAYYLFTLRLIPVFPFWLINLGMGLTPMRTLTFAAISLVGMLPGTFVYVNAGTELVQIQSPKDVMSWPVLGSLALLGLLPLVLKKILRYASRRATGPER
jgi:uncharacterized membrane protein YdjX (TVP38/TMEM64 family)